MSPAPLASVTHLQFLILESLSAGERSGRDLRALLAGHRVKSSAPAFYQMMARLEEGGLIEGWYEQKVVGRQLLKERRYRIARPGQRALAETRAFYHDYLSARRVRKPSHA